MSHPSETELLDLQIKGKFEPTWDSYQSHLQSSELIPYPVQSGIGDDLTDAGYSLFFTAVSFLAQKQGVDNRINFTIHPNPKRARYWGRIAVISYASEAEKVKEEAFMGVHWNPKNGPARELLLNISRTNHLLSLYALREKVPVEEVMEVFPHIEADELERTVSTHALMETVYKENPDRLSSLIVLQSLRRYYHERFTSGLVLHDAHVSLLKARQLIDPSINSTPEIDSLTTANMSAINLGRMEKSILEALIVRDGHEPIAPAAYVDWVNQLLSED